MLYGVMYETKQRQAHIDGWQYLRFESQFDASAVVEDQAREIILRKNVFAHSWTWEEKLSAADIRLHHIWLLESESINDLVPLNHRGVATVDPTIWVLKDGAWVERRDTVASDIRIDRRGGERTASERRIETASESGE